MRQLFVKMWDASRPLLSLPAWLKIVAGYIGGDTPYVWTIQDWQSQGKRKKLPIFVNDHSTPNDAMSDGFAILQRLYVLGVPKGSPVVIDMETSVDPVYLLALWQIIRWAGYKLWVYGSQGSVFQNPACDGYWVATLDGIQRMFPGKSVRATQYVNRGSYDTSWVKIWQYLFTLKTW